MQVAHFLSLRGGARGGDRVAPPYSQMRLKTANFQAPVEALVEAPVWRLHGASMFTDAFENCSFRWLCGSARGGARVAPPQRLHFHRCARKLPIFKPPWRRRTLDFIILKAKS